jgi:DNA repair protein RecN (Recombination protein N)
VLTGTPVGVLRELRVENLLLIEQAELAFSPGLNVLTGETGAGKTVLAHALDLLMGGRARSGIVRPGSQAAYVEGSFSVPEHLREQTMRLLPPSVGSDVDFDQLVLARRVGAEDGRTRAFVDGRSATVSDLRELGALLISFYGQHEHRKLMLAEAQLQMLDEVCGAKHQERLQSYAVSYRKVRELESELERLSELEQARGRELELLEHELAEIDESEPAVQEHQELLTRRERLRRLEALLEAAGRAAEALAPDSSEESGAVALLSSAAAKLQSVGGVDAELDALAERSAAAAIEAQDVAAALQDYCASLGDGDMSLEAIEGRLAGLERLMRKHGGTIESVLDHAERSRARREELLGATVAQEQTELLLAGEQDALARHAAALRTARETAAKRLAKRVRSELGELAMEDATFEIALSPSEPRARGADTAEFMIAPNPGVAAAPLRETASGGELSRVMLALTSASSEESDSKAGSSASSTLVFDEIDAGIGGHTARAVGERLQRLATNRQIVCITHLPQIASLAQRHFTVTKDTSAGETLTRVLTLDEGEVVSELVRMLGASEQDPTARRHARDLLRAA